MDLSKESCVPNVYHNESAQHDGPTTSAELLPSKGRPAAPTAEIADSGQDSDSDPNTYPEGGLRAWSVVLGAWCGLVACFGLMNSIGAFQASVSEVQLKNYSDGDIGWIFSVYVFLAFFCGVLFGPIFDTHGPRWLVLAGSVLLVTAVMLISISSSKALIVHHSCFRRFLTHG
jgi:hypothetical protein